MALFASRFSAQAFKPMLAPMNANRAATTPKLVSIDVKLVSIGVLANVPGDCVQELQDNVNDLVV